VCIRNSGFSAKSKVLAFNKSHCQTESEVLLIRYFSYTQTVGGKLTENEKTINKKIKYEF